jgi:hypothetical protein
MNFATWVLIVGLIGALYAAVIFVPAYIDNLSVRESVDAALTRGFTEPDDKLTEAVILKLNGGPTAVGYHFEEDETGAMVEVPGLNIAPEGVVVVRNEGARTMQINVDYDRVVRLKPTRKFKTLHFHVEKEQSYR